MDPVGICNMALGWLGDAKITQLDAELALPDGTSLADALGAVAGERVDRVAPPPDVEPG